MQNGRTCARLRGLPASRKRRFCGSPVLQGPRMRSLRDADSKATVRVSREIRLAPGGEAEFLWEYDSNYVPHLRQCMAGSLKSELPRDYKSAWRPISNFVESESSPRAAPGKNGIRVCSRAQNTCRTACRARALSQSRDGSFMRPYQFSVLTADDPWARSLARPSGRGTIRSNYRA
jgi:hypothetical protein